MDRMNRRIAVGRMQWKPAVGRWDEREIPVLGRIDRPRQTHLRDPALGGPQVVGRPVQNMDKSCWYGVVAPSGNDAAVASEGGVDALGRGLPVQSA